MEELLNMKIDLLTASLEVAKEKLRINEVKKNVNALGNFFFINCSQPSNGRQRQSRKSRSTDGKT
jgi:hypothetical protein